MYSRSHIAWTFVTRWSRSRLWRSACAAVVWTMPSASASGLDAVRTALDGLDASDEVWDVLKHEDLGSALDVMDAVGELLLEHGVAREQLPQLCTRLIEALGTRGAEVRGAPVATAATVETMGRVRTASASNGCYLDTFAWKREFKSHSERFLQDYSHTVLPNAGAPHVLTIEQRPFGPEGFASTIWDSAIVLSRMLERHGLHALSSAAPSGPPKCIELGAGCGLVGLTLAALGGDAVITDLPENLRLLRANVRANATVSSRVVPRVRPLKWGEPLTAELAAPVPYDIVVATDLFYAREAMPALIETLLALSGPQTCLLLAAGRNRHAGDEFFALARQHWCVARVDSSELDPSYQTDDVDVWRFVRRGEAGDR